MGIFGDKVSNQTLSDLITGGAQSAGKPAFDPSQPFQVADKPPFDPSQPFDAAPSAPQVGIGEDMAKTAIPSMGRMVAGTLGLVGDFDNLLAKGNHYRIDSSGFHYGPSPTGETSLPTSESLQKQIEPYTGNYQPQREPGKILDKAIQFAPAAIGGPETLAMKLATRVAAPAVASELGGNIAGPYGEVAGALAGGVGATAAARKFQEMAAARRAASSLPTGEKLLETGGNQFNQARDMNVVVSPDFTAKAAADMRATLKGFDPEANKAVFAAADRLENLGKPSGQPTTAAQRLQAEMNWEPAPVKPPPLVAMNDVDFIRKELVSLKTSPDGSVRDAARKAIASLQNSQTALTPAETLAGDAAAFTKTTQDAIGNWAAGRRSQTIQGKVNLAELNANSPVGMLDSATGGQALQRTMKQLARPVNNTNMPVARKLGFNNQEVAAITEAASGTKMTHAAELLDRLVPAKLGAIPAMIARQIGGLTTKRQVSALDSLVRSRSPQATQVAAQLNPQIVSQLPAKSQRILQTMVSQPLSPAPSSQSQLPQQASRPVPSQAPIPQAVAPQRPSPIPPQAPPIFAAPKSPPLSTPIASGDGQPSRPSRVGLGENIRLGKYQDWTDGRIVKVGFVDGLRVEGIIPAVYQGDAPGFVLTKGDNVYRVTPHRGMEKLSTAEGAQALRDARQGNRS